MTLEQRVEALEKAMVAMQNANAQMWSLKVNDNMELAGFSDAAHKQAAIDSSIDAIISNAMENNSIPDQLREAMEKAATAGADAAIKRIHQDFASRGPLRRLLG